MKKFILRNKNSIAGIVACVLIGGVTMSFQDTPYVNQIMDSRDTVPDKFSNSTMTMKELDRLIMDLDENMIRVGEDMKKIDMEDIRQQVEMSLKEVDLNKIMKDVEGSLSKIDITKLMADIEISLHNIDIDIDWKDKEGEMKEVMEEAHKELEKARVVLKDIDQDYLRKEMQEAKIGLEEARMELKEINFDRIMREAKIELEEAGRELKEIDMDKVMLEAKAGIDEAKVELRNMKTMFSEMEKDGLIHSAKGFSIEFKNKELFINEVKQSRQVTDKYRKYIKEDHFKIKIEKE